MKRFGCIALSLTAALFAGCGAKQDAATPAADGKKTVTVGFSQSVALKSKVLPGFPGRCSLTDR